MRERRRGKSEKALAAAEAEYRAKLIEALRRCATGHWGLLGQNDHIDMGHLNAQIHERSGAKTLLALGEEIMALRCELGISEPFALHARLLALRSGPKTANDLGEQRLAQAWLSELQ